MAPLDGSPEGDYEEDRLVRMCSNVYGTRDFVSVLDPLNKRAESKVHEGALKKHPNYCVVSILILIWNRAGPQLHRY